MASATQETMRAIIWEGHPHRIAIRSIPKPTLLAKEDAIVRITSAAICGSDLHTYHGIAGSKTPPWQLGHEGIGIVTAIGAAVQALKVGDRVIVPDGVDDGKLDMGPKGLNDYPIFGFGGGFWGLGGMSGLTFVSAEYLRVPQADQSLIPIEYYPSRELHYLFISDIWATAWGALDYSGFQPGETVAVFGAGPVGLLCAYSAILRGAAKVYIVDYIQSRLDKGKSIGAIPINFTHGNAAKQILEREPEGVNRSCDCCGYECLNEKLEMQQNALLNDAIHVTSSGGGIGVIGAYMAQDKAPGRPEADKIAPTIDFPITEFWTKGLTMRGGIVDPKLLAPRLVELVKSGRAKPGFIVSSVIGIEEAEEGYRKFDEKETKVVIRFPWMRDDVNGAVD